MSNNVYHTTLYESADQHVILGKTNGEFLRTGDDIMKNCLESRFAKMYNFYVKISQCTTLHIIIKF